MKGENIQVKISSKLFADDFNNYFITACNQQKVTRLPANVYMVKGINHKHFSSIELLKLK